jgi:hypothetical protein
MWETIMQPLMLLVMLTNGSVVRICEREGGGVTLHVSQGFSHKKHIRSAKSYSDLRFHLPQIPGEEMSGVMAVARVFAGLEGVRECLVSGPCTKREEFFRFMGDQTLSSDGCLRWDASRVDPLDLSTLLTVTPRRSFLTILEALYPLKYQYQGQQMRGSISDHGEL